MRFIFLFLFLIPCFNLQAQDQTKECVATAAAVDSLVKANDYDTAYDQWASSGKCVLESLYANGEKILRYKLASPATEEEKQQYITNLLRLYEKYDKNFPGNNNSNLVKKAMVLHENVTGTSEEVFTLLDKAFKTDRKNFTDAEALYLYFEMYFGKFKSGDKTITEDDIFAKQDEVTLRLEQLYESTGKREYKTANEGVKAMVLPIASCENLNAFYNKNFEAKKADTFWLQKAAGNLSSRNCTSSPLFLNISSEWYKLQPGAKSAYSLGLAHMRNKNPEKAFEYFNISAEAESDPQKKAEVYYTMASMPGGNLPKSIGYTRKALIAKPSFGKAYLLLAQLYVSSNCGETAFDKKAIYFLAAEMARKAGQTDPILKKAAESTADGYLKQAPTKDEIKSAKKAGKKVDFACGINESVIIPK